MIFKIFREVQKLIFELIFGVKSPNRPQTTAALTPSEEVRFGDSTQYSSYSIIHFNFLTIHQNIRFTLALNNKLLMIVQKLYVLRMLKL